MKILKALLITWLMTIAAQWACAQQTGEVTGTVTDATGALVAEATVTATNTATQQVRSASSNDTGTYTLPYLQPGVYELRAEKTGFKLITHPGVNVQVGDIARIDFAMEVGTVSQNVVVNTGEPLLTTESVSLGTVVGSKQIVDLPLNGRDYLSLVALSPNVVAEAPATGSSGLQGGVRQPRRSPSPASAWNSTTTPSTASKTLIPISTPTSFTPPSMRSRNSRSRPVSIRPSSAKAHRRSTSPRVSGTNAYHLVAFEFLRNSYFDAKEWGQVGKQESIPPQRLRLHPQRTASRFPSSSTAKTDSSSCRISKNCATG